MGRCVLRHHLAQCLDHRRGSGDPCDHLRLRRRWQNAHVLGSGLARGEGVLLRLRRTGGARRRPRPDSTRAARPHHHRGPGLRRLAPAPLVGLPAPALQRRSGLGPLGEPPWPQRSGCGHRVAACGAVLRADGDDCLPSHQCRDALHLAWDRARHRSRCRGRRLGRSCGAYPLSRPRERQRRGRQGGVADATSCPPRAS